MRLFSFGVYGLALAALVLVLFGTYDSYPKEQPSRRIRVQINELFKERVFFSIYDMEILFSVVPVKLALSQKRWSSVGNMLIRSQVCCAVPLGLASQAEALNMLPLPAQCCQISKHLSIVSRLGSWMPCELTDHQIWCIT